MLIKLNIIQWALSAGPLATTQQQMSFSLQLERSKHTNAFGCTCWPFGFLAYSLHSPTLWSPEFRRSFSIFQIRNYLNWVKLTQDMIFHLWSYAHRFGGTESQQHLGLQCKLNFKVWSRFRRLWLVSLNHSIPDPGIWRVWRVPITLAIALALVGATSLDCLNSGATVPCEIAKLRRLSSLAGGKSLLMKRENKKTRLVDTFSPHFAPSPAKKKRAH